MRKANAGDQGWSSHVRRWRAAANLSQLQLAERAGVSRQALAAIEAGRQIPSTKLALRLSQILDTDVERLFSVDVTEELHGVRWADGPPPVTGQRVVIGRVDNSWVGHPLGAGELVAANGLLHPADRSRVQVIGPRASHLPVFMAGCAPLLGLLAQRAAAVGVAAVWIADNTARSLHLLSDGLVHIAGMHGANPAALIESHLAPTALVRVRLTRWQQGLVVAPGNPLAITDVADLAQRRLRYAWRERGASVRSVTDQLMADAGSVPPPGPTATSHEEVAAQVRWGAADGGVAIEPVAARAGLGFLPISHEPFDLVIPERHLRTPAVARLLEVARSAAFRFEAATIPGYDCTETGEVIDAAA